MGCESPQRQRRRTMLPPGDDKAEVNGVCIPPGKQSHKSIPPKGNLFLDGVYYLGIHHKMVHLVDGTAFLLPFLMLGVLVVEMAVLRAALLYQTNAVEVVMMEHNGGKQQRTRCHPQKKHISPSCSYHLKLLLKYTGIHQIIAKLIQFRHTAK